MLSDLISLDIYCVYHPRPSRFFCFYCFHAFLIFSRIIHHTSRIGHITVFISEHTGVILVHYI
jgi:hypothetical protein